MKTTKGFSILLLSGVLFFGVNIRGKAQSDAVPASPSSLSETVQPAKSAFNDVGLMVKQVLGEVYTEVGHIPEPQWIEMEPIAEEYVRTLFQARQTPDDDEATQMMEAAQAKFNTAIDAKLTSAQKTKREQYRRNFQAEELKKEKIVNAIIDSLSRQPMQFDAANKVNTASAINTPHTTTPGIRTITVEYK